MEHTAINTETDISLLPQLLNIFVMFQISLLYYENNEEDNVVEDISIKCRKFHISTGLYLKDKIVE